MSGSGDVVTKDGRFDDVARDYDATVQRAIGASGESVQFFADLKARLMAQAVATGAPRTILDFGCGIGNTTRALSRAFPAAHITGFDVSAESVCVAEGLSREVSHRIHFRSAADNRLPFADASFDAAFTACVFHHIDDGERVHWAGELRRVLSPGAPLFLFEHNPFNPLTVRVVRNVPFDEGVVLLRPAYARAMLERAGFVTTAPWFYFFFPAFLRMLRRLERHLRWLPLGGQYFVIGRSVSAESGIR
jgi:ubiquinone/menaquinone biosynthesis C-methylase UbiE